MTGELGRIEVDIPQRAVGVSRGLIVEVDRSRTVHKSPPLLADANAESALRDILVIRTIENRHGKPGGADDRAR